MLGAFVVAGAMLVLTLGCSATQGTADSPEKRSELAAKLAKMSIELGSLDSALDRGAAWAWDASSDTLELQLGRELSADEQTRAQGIMRTVLAEFMTAELWKQAVTGVYSKNFSAAELESIMAFYGSPVGRKVLQLEGTLTQDIDDSLDGLLEGRIEEFIVRLDTELGSAFEGLGDGAGR